MSVTNSEQTLLDQIKDQVAQGQFGVLWIDLGGRGEITCWPIVCERYATAKAKESCEATLKKIDTDQDELYDRLMEEWRDVSENMQSDHILPYLKSKFIVVERINFTDPSNIVIL